MDFETSALARRFTIICLLAAIFGMLFAALVQNYARPAHAYEIGRVIPCVFEAGRDCKAPNGTRN